MVGKPLIPPKLIAGILKRAQQEEEEDDNDEEDKEDKEEDPN